MKIAFGLLCVFLFAAMMFSTRSSTKTPAAATTPTPSPSPNIPDAVELADRATLDDIIAACGEPQRHWMRSGGTGIYEADTQHLWYPKGPAEITLHSEPNAELNCQLDPLLFE